jgi:hypothetical protein
MKYWAMTAAGLGLLVMMAATAGDPALAANAAQMRGQAPIVLAQNEPKKSETVTQKVKKAWRKLTGYKFDVGCPAILPINRYSCTETGKGREDARAKCQSRYALCSVADAK